MCAFPFFNYKYNLIKHFLDHEEEKNNTVHHHIKNFYIFFHKYIIKNKQQYLKYFPHSIIVHLKNDESPHDQSKKPVSVNMSSILVLTSNKPIPSAECADIDAQLCNAYCLNGYIFKAHFFNALEGTSSTMIVQKRMPWRFAPSSVLPVLVQSNRGQQPKLPYHHI
ncbi:hypothetical protein AK88_02531 [Plasmodium fragile]|uniref:Uncharacterized protein n=1 Tax=Plasmodium fragile TaxID=5857 RepID=A0A0D9QL45_PLAFR|nr:uncharacterized protein AK88_02531 [Plasmodium fragile]KJP87775.1 hypothetical protein AK88_02531 [Plasmodium fragile]